MIGRLNMSYRLTTVTSYRMLLDVCISSETCLYRALYKTNFTNPNVRTLNYANLYKPNIVYSECKIWSPGGSIQVGFIFVVREQI